MRTNLTSSSYSSRNFHSASASSPTAERERSPIQAEALEEPKVPSHFKRKIKLVKRHSKLFFNLIGASIVELGSRFIRMVSNATVGKIFKQKIDAHRLLKGNKVDESKQEWLLNAALLKDAKESTDDPEVRNQIDFMINNYLTKATPVHDKTFRLINKKFRGLFQTSAPVDYFYHRMANRQDAELSKILNNYLPWKKVSPFIMTDTTEFSSLLPLKFNLLPLNPNEIRQELQNTLRPILANTSLRNLSKHSLEKPFLIDATEIFQGAFFDPSKNPNALLKKFKKMIKREISATARGMCPGNLIRQKKLEKYIYNNLTCISRLNVKGIAGIKILPIQPKLHFKNISKQFSYFQDFIDATGLFIGAVTMRQITRTPKQIKNVEYAVKGSRDPIEGYTPDSLLSSATFTRLSEAWSSPEIKTEKPHLYILGSSTLKLIEGLMEEINIDIWDNIQNEAQKKVLQTTLYRIHLHLADAELHKDNYIKFSQAIELIHSELATILEITKPFEEDEFPFLYGGEKEWIPEELQDYTQFYLGKTAVNTFAGILTAVSEKNPEPVCIAGKGLYYEEAGFFSSSHTLDEAIKDPSIKEISLYSCQFHPNIDIDYRHTHYESDDIVANVEAILEAKPQTEHMTVAVDCTIDFKNSERVTKLLDHFKEEIESGKLNFVFFRSGQKFDMLGMDNYYGSPFYIVNNRDEYWESFNQFPESPAHKTDPLSLQWFSLANTYISKEMDEYREQIFKNTRELLDHVPKVLLPTGDPKQKIRVNTAAENMEPCFLDIKVVGRFHRLKSLAIMAYFYAKCLKKGIKAHSRASFGFFHPNCIIISINAERGSSSIRINPGLNPEENKTLIKFLKGLVHYI